MDIYIYIYIQCIYIYIQYEFANFWRHSQFLQVPVGSIPSAARNDLASDNPDNQVAITQGGSIGVDSVGTQKNGNPRGVDYT